MNFKIIVNDVLDEYLESVVALDGSEDRIQSSGWLQEHDVRFHHGHFDPASQTCSLRQKLAIGDDADRLNAGDRQGVLLNLAENCPSRSQYEALIYRLMNTGVLSRDDAQDIQRMGQSAFNALRDNESADAFTDEMIDNIIALSEIYTALSSAYPEQINATSPVQSSMPERPSQEPFNQTGELPQNHPLRHMIFSAENMNRSVREVGGMPYNFTSVNQITPERLAVLAGQLPVRGIFDHRDGSVDIRGYGRIQGGEAIRMMLIAPSLSVGTEMRRRLANWMQNHQNDNSTGARAIKRINQALSLFYPPTASNQDTSSNSSPITGVPREINVANQENAKLAGLADAYKGHQISLRNSMRDGCNCWKCATANLLRARGFQVQARSEKDNSYGGSSNTREFIKSQTACARVYENIGFMEPLALRDKLNTILQDDSTYPDGTAILMWEGHGTLAIKQGRQFKFIDGWPSYGQEQMFDPEQLLEGYKYGFLGRDCPIYTKGYESGRYAQAAANFFEQNRDVRQRVRNALRTPVSERSSEQLSLLNTPFPTAPAFTYEQAAHDHENWCITKRNLLHRLGRVPTDEEIRQEINSNPTETLYGKINGSWIVKPNQPLIPELFMLTKNAPI